MIGTSNYYLRYTTTTTTTTNNNNNNNNNNKAMDFMDIDVEDSPTPMEF
jgi:hypothetical protein